LLDSLLQEFFQIEWEKIRKEIVQIGTEAEIEIEIAEEIDQGIEVETEGDLDQEIETGKNQVLLSAGSLLYIGMSHLLDLSILHPCNIKVCRLLDKFLQL